MKIKKKVKNMLAKEFIEEYYNIKFNISCKKEMNCKDKIVTF